MKRALVLASLLAAGCGNPEAPAMDAQADRAAVEAVVADCDRGARSRDCDHARQVLAQARREDRLATYRQGF